MPKIVAQKNDWLKLGFKLFSRKGPAGIVVEQMSKSLGCNKSSFYWHFKSKDTFILDLVNMWKFNDTQLIINLADKESGIEERMNRFIALVFQKDPNLDFVFYLKRYAIDKPEIQISIDEIDAQRLKYVHSLLMDLGFEEDSASIKASIMYKYLIGFHEMYRYKTMEPGYLDDVKRDLSMMIGIHFGSDVFLTN